MSLVVMENYGASALGACWPESWFSVGDSVDELYR